MVGASEDYLDRYCTALPKYVDSIEYHSTAWAKLAKLAGLKDMVFTTKDHNGFCMWPTSTNFSIATTPYKNGHRKSVWGCLPQIRSSGRVLFSPVDFPFLAKQGRVIRRFTFWKDMLAKGT